MNTNQTTRFPLPIASLFSVTVIVASLFGTFVATATAEGRMKRQDSVRARIEIYSKVHYPGWQVKRVSPDPMCDGSPAFEASLARHGYQPIALIFTPRGEFVQLEEDIPFANVPSEVRAAATSAYRTYHISHTVERLTLASGEVQYLFDLSKGRVSKEATFDQHGSMICEH